MQREFVGQVATLGHLDRVDFTDEVGNRGIGRGQLFAEPSAAMDPSNRGVVAVFGDEILRVLTDRVVRVVEHFGPSNDREPLVEQFDHRADHAGLALTALAQKDHVVAGEDGVFQLRKNGLVVAKHAGEQRFTGGDPGDGVASQLLFDGDGLPAAGLELSEGRCVGVVSHKCTVVLTGGNATT